MRILLAAGLFIATLALSSSLYVREVSAKQAPWCAVISSGTDDTIWDCQYRSIEDCRPNVIAGNRGTCNHNPRYRGEAAPSAAHLTHKKRPTG
jgi:hypothetical protein